MMYIAREIQFIIGFNIPYDRNLSHHTNGERLSVVPNTTKTISHSIPILFICGGLVKNHQHGHNEDHVNQHQNRDISN